MAIFSPYFQGRAIGRLSINQKRFMKWTLVQKDMIIAILNLILILRLAFEHFSTACHQQLLWPLLICNYSITLHIKSACLKERDVTLWRSETMKVQIKRFRKHRRRR